LLFECINSMLSRYGAEEADAKPPKPLSELEKSQRDLDNWKLGALWHPDQPADANENRDSDHFSARAVTGKRFSKRAIKHFLSHAPILWQELGLTQEQYFDPARIKAVRKLADFYDRVLKRSPNTYLSDVLQDRVRRTSFRPSLKGVWHRNKLWNRASQELADYLNIERGECPVDNIVYQALVEMVRGWPKKERHTHISASIPLEMIVREMGEGLKRYKGYREAMHSLVERKVAELEEKSGPEYAETMREFKRLLLRHADWGQIPLTHDVRNLMGGERPGNRDIR
ncbi:unnamed protein product, partial [marine sediment metagenome]